VTSSSATVSSTSVPFGNYRDTKTKLFGKGDHPENIRMQKRLSLAHQKEHARARIVQLPADIFKLIHDMS